MDLHFADFIPPDLQHTLIAILVGTICGFVVGFEREMRGKPAGIRTFILITVGSALFTIVSGWAVVASVGTAGDSARVIAQIVSGVGFLGAGAIIQSSGTVTGMTTAAYVWALAAIGVIIGLERYATALASTFLLLLIMTIFDRVEVAIHSRFYRNYFLAIRFDKLRKKSLEELRELMNRFNVHNYRITRFLSKGQPIISPFQVEGGDIVVECRVSYPFGGFQRFLESIYDIKGVLHVDLRLLPDDDDEHIESSTDSIEMYAPAIPPLAGAGEGAPIAPGATLGEGNNPERHAAPKF